MCRSPLAPLLLSLLASDAAAVPYRAHAVQIKLDAASPIPAGQAGFWGKSADGLPYWRKTDGSDVGLGGAASIGTGFFGDGSDGVCAFDGVANVPGTINLGGNVYRLVRDLYCAAMTVSAGVTVRSADVVPGNAWRIFVRDTCTISGTLAARGGAGTGANAGLNVVSGSIEGSAIGGAGNPGAGSPGSGIAMSIGGAGGVGGAGGGGGGGAGGSPTIPPATAGGWRNPWVAVNGALLGAGQGAGLAWLTGGAGGGGGGGNGADSGGGGGGGGGVLILVARSLTVANGGTITAAGGAGAAGAVNGSGGGGGGGGGAALLVYGAISNNGTITAAGGASGAGGGGAGQPGAAGASGAVLYLPLQ